MSGTYLSWSDVFSVTRRAKTHGGRKTAPADKTTWHGILHGHVVCVVSTVRLIEGGIAARVQARSSRFAPTGIAPSTTLAKSPTESMTSAKPTTAQSRNAAVSKGTWRTSSRSGRRRPNANAGTSCKRSARRPFRASSRTRPQPSAQTNSASCSAPSSILTRTRLPMTLRSSSPATTRTTSAARTRFCLPTAPFGEGIRPLHLRTPRWRVPGPRRVCGEQPQSNYSKRRPKP